MSRKQRGRHLKSYDQEEEVYKAIVEEAKRRITGYYSGYLSNGNSYEVDLTLEEDFTMDMDLEIEFNK